MHISAWKDRISPIIHFWTKQNMQISKSAFFTYIFRPFHHAAIRWQHFLRVYKGVSKQNDSWWTTELFTRRVNVKLWISPGETTEYRSRKFRGWLRRETQGSSWRTHGEPMMLGYREMHWGTRTIRKLRACVPRSEYTDYVRRIAVC